MRRRRRNKKSKTMNNVAQTSTKEKYNLVELPLDLVIEIIGRLPAKSVARFLAVSKLWAATIRSRDFITSFPLGSSSQPNTLIGGREVHYGPTNRRRRFHIWHLLPSSSLSTSFLSILPSPFPYGELGECSFHHVNGLISAGYGTNQIVSNPSTGRHINLPTVKTSTRVIKSFFGYDSVNDQYKVLCIMEIFCQHQVFTLGGKSWTIIDCSIDHCPWTNGVCIDNVVYYVAKTGVAMSHLSLMRFDLRSESLDLFSNLPSEMPPPGYYTDSLINYKGKVAKPTRTTTYTFDVWIMDQDSDRREWLKILTFSIEPWKSLFGDVSIIGITQTGDFVLVPSHCFFGFYVFHYDPDMDSFRKIQVSLSSDGDKFCPLNSFRDRSHIYIIYGFLGLHRECKVVVGETDSCFDSHYLFLPLIFYFLLITLMASVYFGLAITKTCLVIITCFCLVSNNNLWLLFTTTRLANYFFLICYFC